MKMPTVIIDEIGYTKKLQRYATKNNMYIMQFTCGTNAAREAVDFLVRKGHRSFAFISPSKRRNWSDIRRDSLKQHVAHYSLPLSLIIFEIDSNDAFDKTIHVPRTEITETALEQLKKLDRQFPPVVMRTFASQSLRMHITSILRDTFWIEYLDTHIKKIISPQKISAIIAVNDTTAINCIRALEAKGIQVPDDISVISFDDTFAAADAAITSYNFNVSGAANMAVNFLINPSHFASRKTRGTIEVPGYIVERESVKKI
jgi:DNA-binding LacI/PurR family transcriptional regulator